MEELKSILDKLGSLKYKIDGKESSNNDKLVIFIGVLLQIISSKKIFKKNSDVAEFLSENFDLEFAEYCKKSRPILLGKTARFFLDGNETFDLNEGLNTIYTFMVKLLENKADDISWSDVIKSIKL